MGSPRQVLPVLLCLAIVSPTMVNAFNGVQDKELAKKIHQLCKKILHEIYVGRHEKYENDKSIPQNVRIQIPEGENIQTVAMGVDKKNKRIVVAGNIYTNEYKKDGSYTVTQLGFMLKEIQQIYSIIRNDPEFKDFSITIVQPDDMEMRRYQQFVAGPAIQKIKNKWWDAEKVKMENSIKNLEANRKIPPNVKREKIQTARQNFRDLKPPKSLLEYWKELEKTVGAGDAARAVHAEVQIATYLAQTLEPSERKNFVIQASKPYCVHCKDVMTGKIGHVNYSGGYRQKGPANQDPKNWGQLAWIVVAGKSAGAKGR